jgi:hypothetical protein
MSFAIMQNIIVQDLERRGFEVFTGRIDSSTIDFVAVKFVYDKLTKEIADKVYIQIIGRNNDDTVVLEKKQALCLTGGSHKKYLLSTNIEAASSSDNINIEPHAETETIIDLTLPQFLLLENI